MSHKSIKDMKEWAKKNKEEKKNDKAHNKAASMTVVVLQLTQHQPTISPTDTDHGTRSLNGNQEVLEEV